MSKSKVKPIQLGQVAYRPAQFAASCGFSRSLFYALKGDQQPRSIKLGRRRVVVEDPRSYLARIAAQQAQTA